MRFSLASAAAVMILLMSGCYQDEVVIVHEPGVYKGSSDPLLSQAASDRAPTLSERLMQIQVDR